MADSAGAAPVTLEQTGFPEQMQAGELARAMGAAVGIQAGQAQRTLLLLDEGNTVPFIARYRKELTGGLDEVQIQGVADAAASVRTLHARKYDVLRLIAEQGRLTRALAQTIIAAAALQAVDDLYLPYRPKRKTRASSARERGLGPLAELILRQERQPRDALAAAAAHVNAERGVETAEAALAGARDICAEVITEDAAVRGAARALYLRESVVRARLTVDADQAETKDPKGLYRLYYDYQEPIGRLVPHRTLALNRAEREDVVRLSVDLPIERARPLLHERYPVDARSPFADHLRLAVDDGYKRLLAPALEREARAALTERAEAHAINVFATNLRHLLLQPPLRGARVLGLDPGFRTGCKVAVVDATGAYVESTTIYPHAPQGQWAQAKATLRALLARHQISVIAIGNGTASRETEQLAAEVIGAIEQAGGKKGALGYVMVNEAGASVYSASAVARQEFPALDATQRGTISIARRLQDPLAELVKIDPKAVGVGLYQHDVDERALADALERVVVSCVNFAGVELNSASPQVLRAVSGITARVAEAIVAYRAEHGSFASRAQLRKVPGLGPAAFVQSAGFLKIAGGREPLDNTFIHPESYETARAVLARLPGGTNGGGRIPERVRAWRAQVGDGTRQQEALRALAAELRSGAPTLADILENLEKPGLDPRD
ncbi:MAG TPA: Tex-like N-terminal domain-containing protein, partial [Ktedonobacterales bacterium]